MSTSRKAVATASEQQVLPDQGGSYERSDGGELRRLESTEPAPDRAKAEPDEQGTARPAEEPSSQPQQAESGPATQE